MAVIFDIKHKSDQGRDYKMEIIDNDGGSFIGDITVNSDGFRIEDTGDNRDLHQTIIGKAVSFTIQVTNTDIENFLTSLTTSDEGRYFTKLYLDTDVIFIGVITTDNVTIDNFPKPYDFKLEAVDGLKLLKGEVFEPAFDPETSSLFNLFYYIQNSMRSLPTLAEYGVSDSFIGVSTNWWSKEHIDNTQDSGNVLEKTYTDFKSFTGDPPEEDRVNSPGRQPNSAASTEFVFFDCLSIIRGILQSFNCRMYYDNGFYHIQQLGIRDTTTYDELIYNAPDATITYSLLTTDTVTPGVDIDQSSNFHLAGGKIKLIPPLRAVNATYEINANFNLLKTEQEVNWLRDTGEEDIAEVIDTDEIDTLTCSFRIVQLFPSSAAEDTNDYDVGFKLTLKIADKVLGNVNGRYAWFDAATNPNQFVGIGFDEPPELPRPFYINGFLPYVTEILFTTEEIPAGGTLTFNLEPAYRYFGPGQSGPFYDTTADLPSAPNPLLPVHMWFLAEGEIIQTVDGNAQGRVPRTVTASQEAGTGSLNRTIIISDGTLPSRPGVMSIKESDEYIATSGWKIGSGSGTYDGHLDLVTKTILSQRLKVLRIYQGTIYAKTDFMSIANTYTYSGFTLLTNKTKLTTNLDHIDVELIEFSEDTTGITNEEIETQIELGGSNAQVGIGGGITTPPNLDDPPSTGREGLITSEVIKADVTITSVPILEADDDYFVTGDEIIIKDNITGYEHKVTVAAPLSQGDTSITIESYTPSLNIAIYSAITFAPGQLLNLRPKYELFDSTTGTELTVTNFDLPDETVLSNTEMSRRLRIFRQTSKLVYNIGYTVDSANNKINLAWPLTSDEYVEVELL